MNGLKRHTLECNARFFTGPADDDENKTQLQHELEKTKFLTSALEHTHPQRWRFLPCRACCYLAPEVREDNPYCNECGQEGKSLLEYYDKAHAFAEETFQLGDNEQIRKLLSAARAIEQTVADMIVARWPHRRENPSLPKK